MGDDETASVRHIISGIALVLLGVSLALVAFDMHPVSYAGEPCLGQSMECTQQYTWSQEEAGRASLYIVLSLSLLGLGGFVVGFGLARRFEWNGIRSWIRRDGGVK